MSYVGPQPIPLGGQTVEKRFTRKDSTWVAPGTLEDAVSLTEVKNHAKISGTADDADLAIKIDAAIEWCENYTNRAFTSRGYKMTLEEFSRGPIYLERSPAQAVTALKYYATTGTLTTLSSSLYTVDSESEPARIVPVYSGDWPSIQDRIGAVQVFFTAGYGDTAATVPQSLRQAVMVLAATWYAYREALIGQVVNEIKMTLDALLGPYVVYMPS